MPRYATTPLATGDPDTVPVSVFTEVSCAPGTAGTAKTIANAINVAPTYLDLVIMVPRCWLGVITSGCCSALAEQSTAAYSSRSFLARSRRARGTSIAACACGGTDAKIDSGRERGTLAGGV